MKRWRILVGCFLAAGVLGLGWGPARPAETAASAGAPRPGREAGVPPQVPAAVGSGNWWRFGVVAPQGVAGHEAQLEDLKAGAYLDFGYRLSPARPGGIEYIQVLRVRDDIYPTVLIDLPGLVAANPGAYWEVGNEPDTTYENQDNVPPETYADRFFEIATQIRSLDSTARIGFGTIVQPTPIRLRYLERAWQRLIVLAGSPEAASALIDFWNVHAFILNEWGSWGTGIPQGFLCESSGAHRCWDDFQGPVFDCDANLTQCWTPVEITDLNDTHDNAIFNERAIALRQWMAGIGEQDKPLWITEYGSLFPPIDPPGGFPDYVNVSDIETARFMTQSFDYLLNTTDAAIGCPSDGNRLVQRWFWYSLNDHRYTFGGTLYDPDNSRARTEVGTAWINYVDPPVFADVPIDHWARDNIEALYHGGFVVGCSYTPRLYCPERILIRAESAVFILRGAYGAIVDPPYYPPPATPTFTDVSPGYWGYGWIESLWRDAYTAGCWTSPMMFCPLRQHTRAEGSVFFLRIKNGVTYEPPEPEGLFADVPLDRWPPEPWYAAWVEAAYNQGLLPACSTVPLNFCPEGPLDRSWAAYMMVQAKGGLPLPTPTP